MTTIVITGAASHLGSFAVRCLHERTSHDIVAVTSGREAVPRTTDPRVRWLAVDLRTPLAPQIAALIAQARRVLHFAWTRTGTKGEVGSANAAMISNLMDAMPDRSRFWFISSVSASPRPFSTYGQTKFECTSLVESLGGSTLVCGLVVEEQPSKGPYRMLRNVVGKVPFALRAIGGGPLVFPIRLDDMGATLVRVVEDELPPGTFRMFSPPVRFNRFISLLEQFRPRMRVPIPFSARLAIWGAGLGKRTHLLPERICDQVMTFLYKDETYLLAHKDVPGARPRPCENRNFFLGT